MLKNWKKKIDNDMDADAAQCERSNIKCYALTFSNIQISELYCKKSKTNLGVDALKLIYNHSQNHISQFQMLQNHIQLPNVELSIMSSKS